MATVFRPSFGIWQGSTTATTGGTVTLDVIASTGKLNFRDRYANGATGVPLQLYDATSGITEFSYGTLTYGGGGPSTDTISSRVVTYSTNGPATPVAWGAGTRNAWCNVAPESLLCAENALAEMNNTQLVATLARLGVVFGTAAGNTVKLDGSARYPAADGSQITGLPASPIPSGSKTIFYQAAAPAGWTLDASIDDMTVFITNGAGITGGGPHAGGTTDTTYGFDNSVGLSIGNHALTTSEIPTANTAGPGFGVLAVAAAGTGAGHNHTISSVSTYRPNRAFFRLCIKT